MAKVEMYGQSKVTKQVAPAVQHGTFRPQDSTGQVYQALGGLADAFVENKKRIDTAEADEATINFERAKNDLFTNSDIGYKAQGFNAWDNKDALSEAYQGLYDEHFGGLSPSAQELAKPKFDAYYTSDTAKMDMHAQNGFSGYEDQLHTDSIESNVESAAISYNDVAVSDVHMRNIINTAKAIAAKKGLDAVSVEELVDDNTMIAVNAMVDAALDREDVSGANSVLDNYGSMIQREGGAAGLKAKINAKKEALQKKNDTAVVAMKAQDIFQRSGGNIASMNKMLTQVDPRLRGKVRGEMFAQVSASNAAKSQRIHNTVLAYEKSGQSFDQFYAENQGSIDEMSASQRDALRQGKKTVTAPYIAAQLEDLKKTGTPDAKRQIGELLKEYPSMISKQDLGSYAYFVESSDSFVAKDLSKFPTFKKTLDGMKPEVKNELLSRFSVFESKYHKTHSKNMEDADVRDWMIGALKNKWFDDADYDFQRDDFSRNTEKTIAYNGANRYMGINSNYNGTDEDDAALQANLEEFYADNGRYPSERDYDRFISAIMTPEGNIAPPTADGGEVQMPDKIEEGNIDLNNRPVIKNDDGSISTVSSITIGVDNKHVNIPTIINGMRVSNEEAEIHYRNSGEHLGSYRSKDGAIQAAKEVSKRQEKVYTKNEPVEDEYTEQDLDADLRLLISAGLVEEPEQETNEKGYFEVSDGEGNYYNPAEKLLEDTGDYLLDSMRESNEIRDTATSLIGAQTSSTIAAVQGQYRSVMAAWSEHMATLNSRKEIAAQEWERKKVSRFFGGNLAAENAQAILDSPLTTKESKELARAALNVNKAGK